MGTSATECRATRNELEAFLLSTSEAAEFDPRFGARGKIRGKVQDRRRNHCESDGVSERRRRNRRESDRVLVDDMYVAIEGLDGELISDAARVINTSTGGMCVEVCRRVPLEAILTIWFTTEAGDRRYTLGRVVHRSRKGRGYYLGVQLTDTFA